MIFGGTLGGKANGDQRMINRRGIKWLVGLAASLLLVFLALALALPRFIDSEAMKEKARAFVSRQAPGAIGIEKMEVSWFPRPAIVVRGATVSIPDNLDGTVQSIRAYPSVRALMVGRIVVSRLVLERPAVTARWAARPEEPLDLEDIEKTLRAVLAIGAAAAPPLVIRIDDGSAMLRIGNRAAVEIKDLHARLVAGPRELSIAAAASSNISDRIRVEVRISGENLVTEGTVAIEHLRLRNAMASLLSQPIEHIEDGDVSLNLALRSMGTRTINVQVDAPQPSVVLARGGDRVAIKAHRAKGAVAYEKGSIRATLEQLDLVSPRLSVSGEMSLDQQSSGVRMRLEGRQIDVSGVRDAALKIAGHSGAVAGVFHTLRGGTIPEMKLEGSGPSLADAMRAKNIRMTGQLREGKLFVPGAALDLNDVDGAVVISGGILEANEFRASLGGIKGRDGKLKLGLEGENAPFRLDIEAQADAAELRALLLRFVKDDELKGELLKIHDVEGEVSGRLSLGENLDALAPSVTVSETRVSASYDRIPQRIAVKEGRFKYHDGTITVAGLRGTIGRSSVSGITAAGRNDATRHIEISSGSVSLDLEEARALLLSFEQSRTHVAAVRAATGKVDISSLFLGGPLLSPNRWAFKSAGTLRDVAVTHADLPGPISIARGKFEATEARITLSGAALDMLDASLVASGVLDHSSGEPMKAEASGEGAAGEQMIRWLSRQFEMPQDVMLRSPVKISGGRIDWRAGGDVALRGKVTVGGGPQVSVDATRTPEGVVVRDLTVEDGARRAHMTLRLANDNLDVSFKGSIDRQMLDHMFVAFPVEGDSLQGDIQMSAALSPPLRMSARGQLEGTNLLVPWDQAKILVERVRLEASGESVLIRSADLRWHNSRLAVSGNVVPGNEAVRVDLDVTADRLDWDELSRSFGHDGAIAWLPPVRGVVRLKADSVVFEAFSLNGFQMTAAIGPSGAGADIDQGTVCGINATGRVDVAAKEIRLDIRFAAREADLEPASVCLTNRKSDIKGTYTLRARLTGGGDAQHLLQSLKGEFEVTARDGEFVRSASVDRTFDYLNATGDFKVAFPDLAKSAFPYRSVSAKGRIDGAKILDGEFVIQASPLTLTAQGGIDVERKHIDLKALVSVSMPGSQVIRHIPLIGGILRESLVGIPIRITGSLDRPDVTYLSPADVGAELLNVPLRILGAPLDAMRLFTPSGKPR